MKDFAIKTGINGVGLWVAAFVVHGITLTQAGTTWQAKTITIIAVALIFGIINAIVRPVVKFFSIPFLIVTLGLFTFIVNALMLEVLSWVSGKLDLAFHVQDFFWDAVFGAVIVSFVSLVLHVLLPDEHKPQR